MYGIFTNLPQKSTIHVGRYTDIPVSWILWVMLCFGETRQVLNCFKEMVFFGTWVLRVARKIDSRSHKGVHRTVKNIEVLWYVFSSWEPKGTPSKATFTLRLGVI